MKKIKRTIAVTWLTVLGIAVLLPASWALTSALMFAYRNPIILLIPAVVLAVGGAFTFTGWAIAELES